MANTDQLIDGYLDGELSLTALKRLEDWIHESRENTNYFVRRVSDHQEFRSCLVGNEKLELLTLSIESGGDEASQLLLELLAIERQSADPELVDITEMIAEKEAKTSARLRNPDRDQEAVTRRVIVVPRWLAWGAATAAALALITLIAVPINSRSGSGALNTNNDELPGPSLAIEEPIPPVVAHMITSADTAWRTQPSAETLREGQVLELLKGTAELQFNSTARVTMSAGTRLVLTGENACEMQEGMLSGVCPPGAEGFEVSLPGGLLRDLGTEFSIEITDSGLSKVLVTDGLVEIGAMTVDGAWTQDIEISPGMIGEIDREAGLIRVTEQQELLLSNSAAGRSAGDRDSNWLVTAISTDSDYEASPSVVLDLRSSAGTVTVPWPANTNASGWIGVPGQGSDVPEGQVTTFRYSFNIPEGAALDSLIINASIWADDSVEAILVNGATVMGSDSSALKDVHYLKSKPIDISGVWKIGENKIGFLVKNKTDEPNPFHHSGLRVEFDPALLNVTRIHRPNTGAIPEGL